MYVWGLAFVVGNNNLNKIDEKSNTIMFIDLSLIEIFFIKILILFPGINFVAGFCRDLI